MNRCGLVSRSVFLLLLIVPAFFGCMRKEAEVTTRIHIVSGMRAFIGIAEGFMGKMQELGYEEGKNIHYYLHEVQSGSEEERKILEQITADKSDLVLAYPTGTAVAAKRLLAGSVPLVFGMGNVADTGLVETVRRPGGNTTGVRAPSTDVVLKRFEYLLQVIPNGRRVYTAYNPDYAGNQSVIPKVIEAAERAGVEIVQARVGSVEELRADLEARERSGKPGIDGILITADSINQSVEGWPLVSQFAARHGIPVSGGSAAQAETGAVLSYAVDFYETGGIAAVIADKILNGNEAGTIPVATADMALLVNYRLAQELGLSVPQVLLNIADKILQ